ncbi:ABC transporter permease [Rhodovibrio salinarum]|uniref:ABC transporter permease n=1 Tax=Rhodovibrio salinarum TaxID=1087 RepID=A0A934V102_9PROT|nr:ABC transporter permease subunit [Rhodovibrio salinarum]MBK1698892.1 ABC transporter permease [Rhodovibrio salinarum]
MTTAPRQLTGLTPPAAAAAVRRPEDAWLRVFPVTALALFLAPIGAGLVYTWLPAFGWFPALGGDSLTLQHWRTLLATPGLGASVRLTLTSGVLATALSLTITIGFVAAAQGTRTMARVRRFLAPLLAVPHVAVAIGLAFLIAPSGWAARLVSPWLTGWSVPPALASVQDPYGLALAAALVVKEVPYLLLMTLAALDQTRADKRLAVARSLGYGPVVAWLKTVLPAVYGQIRLPIYAVLAFSLSVVDVALVLGPGTPPPLAVQVFRWFNDPDLMLRFVGAAGAALQLLLVAGAILAWNLLERGIMRLGRRWIAAGTRGGPAMVARASAKVAMVSVQLLSLAGLVVLAVWSLTGRWRYPDALPTSWRLDNWTRQLDTIWLTGSTTLICGLAATGIALLLTLGCLENEQRNQTHPTGRALWLLYLPLLVPQVSFLFGAQVLAVRAGLDGTWPALVWSHLLFVLPYLFLSLADAYRALDPRYPRAALCLGARPGRVFWRVKLPMLARPILFAFAVGFAVSVTQYLPTVFAGAGRFATFTTEAVAQAGGGDRRIAGVFALLQALLPLALFAAAIALPAWLFRNRRALEG